jgi:hypothetical protein
LTIASDVYLTEQEGSEFGGVILMANSGEMKRRIVVSNTLLDRVNLTFELALPSIRQKLYPEN